MNKANNTQFHKNQYTKQYGLLTPMSSRELPSKFHRKPNPKARVQATSKQWKNRGVDETLAEHTLCYISSPVEKDDLFRSARSNSTSVNPSKSKNHIHGLRNPYHNIPANSQNQPQESSNPISSSHNRQKSRTKTSNDFHQSPAIQIEELKLVKKNLLEQLKDLKQKIENKNKTIDRLEVQINQKDLRIKQVENSMSQLLSKYEKLIQKNQEQRVTIENYEAMLPEKQDQKKSVQTRQDLERILSDINRGFDEISLDSKLQEESKIVGQPRLEQVIVSLHEKIKYQDIEIAMLKKSNYNLNQMELKVMKLQNQNDSLWKRLKQLNEKAKEQEKKQISFDYSISFDFSRDQELRNH